jgi:hypothetical protein
MKSPRSDRGDRKEEDPAQALRYSVSKSNKSDTPGRLRRCSPGDWRNHLRTKRREQFKGRLVMY